MRPTRHAHRENDVVVGLATSCIIHTQEPPSRATTTTTSGGVHGSSAVRRIADARCDREAACNHVGDGHRYADRNACLREMRRDANDMFDDKSCASGIDERRLDTCIEEIRSERCGNPIDSIERSASCRRGELCRGR